MEQMSVAIKKHMHKSFERPKMVEKKKFLMCCEHAPGIWRRVVRGAASNFGTHVDGVYGRGVRSGKEPLNGARGTLHCAFSRVRVGAGGGHFVLEVEWSG